MKNKIRHLKEKQDNMKKERAAYKVALKNQQYALKSVSLFIIAVTIKSMLIQNRGSLIKILNNFKNICLSMFQT